MKLSKKDTSLNEKDTLQDMLEAEKRLMSYYSAAIAEGSGKFLRKELLKHYSSSADTQLAVFEQLLARGYREATPAEKPLIDETTKRFSKALKEIKSD